MPRIEPQDLAKAPPAVQAAGADHERSHARLTNMKRTLLHSLPAFNALMSWYPLRDTVAGFIGDRGALVFAHAISAETDCLICSTFFRRMLIEQGENPDALTLTADETALVELGRHLATPPYEVPDGLYEQIARSRTDEQMVTLIAFGSIMLATNVFNNALDVPLDQYLEPFRRKAG